MPLAILGEVLLGQRVTALGGLEGGATLASAVDATTGDRTTLVVAALDHVTSGVDPARVLDDQVRYALGTAGLARATRAGVESAFEGSSARLVVVYAASSGTDLRQLPNAGAIAGEIARGIARAVAPLHDQGIAHGCLRPDLVFWQDGAVVVQGFGVEACLRMLGGTRAAAEALPPAYRAPEREGGGAGPATPASDLYALGVILRELVGEGANEKVRALIDGATADSPVARPSDISMFAGAVAKALEAPAAPVQSAPPVPEPEPEPEPAAPAPPAPQPKRPEIAPMPGYESSPASRRGNGGVIFVLALIAGIGLLLTAVGGLFVFALMRRPSTVSVAAPATAYDAGASTEEEPFDAGTTPVEPPETPDASAPPPEQPEVEHDAGTSSPSNKGAPGPVKPVAGTEDVAGPLPLGPDVPLWGGAHAPVSVVVFGDLECPHTRRAYQVLEALTRAFPSDVRIAWRHRPLTPHTHARDAARVAAGIRHDLGDTAFWRFVAEASRGSDTPDRAHLESWARAAGADAARITTWLSRSDTDAEVRRDLVLAGLFDVRETPTFFVNGMRIEGYQPLDALKSVIEKELAAARGLQALGTQASDLYVARVKKNLLGVGTDVAVRTCPAVAGSPVRGNADALVTIVEFSDFECPYCRRVQPTLDTLLAHFGGDVRLVWKNFPLDMHPHARPEAAFALEAFNRGGPTKFWKVHDLLFDLSGHIDEAHLSSVASSAGLDPTPLLDAAEHKGHDPKIEADVRLGQKLGVTGTPTFYVNGRQLVGAQSLARFQVTVQDELDNARHLVSSGTPRSRIYDVVCGAH